MADYSDGKPSVQPGRVNITQHHEHKSETVDVQALARAVAVELAKTMASQQVQGPTQNVVAGRTNTGQEFEDDFDNKDTLAKLADSMTVHKPGSESNFQNLGGVKETKKDEGKVNSTIDILKDID